MTFPLYGYAVCHKKVVRTFKYEDRLKYLYGFTYVKVRRIRGDMIEVYWKI